VVVLLANDDVAVLEVAQPVGGVVVKMGQNKGFQVFAGVYPQ
jgi:hypothetical protein